MKDACAKKQSNNGKDKLSIAMFGHKRIPSREGGIEIVVEELARGMTGRGHQITCYNRRGHHVSGAEFDSNRGSEYNGICLKTVPTIEKKGLAAASSSFFAALFCAFNKYDVVHIHAEGPAVFCWIPHIFRKKVVITVHGLDHLRAKWQGGFGAKYILLGEKMAVKYADEIIVLSKGVEQYFMDTYGRRTNFIPNGVSKPVYAEPDLILKMYGLDKDSYILYLGRIVPEKGEHYLLKAFRDVKTRKKLVIAGGASDTDEYMKELKTLADGDERVVFTGFVQGKVLQELYSNAYIYVLPSDLEGMPLSLLEAMSYGNCCLTSDISECTEVIGDYAVTFKKGDVMDLKERLLELCEDEAKVNGYKEMAADYICGKYDWDQVVKQTVALYKK